MSDQPVPRSGRLGGLLVVLVVAGSAVGVIGWHLRAERSAPALDVSGFDLGATSERPRAALPAPSSAPAPQSGLGMLKAEKGIRIAGAGENEQAAPTASARPASVSTAPARTPPARPQMRMDQSKTVSDVLNNPEVQKALRQQGQQAPPVSLPGQ